MASPPLTFPSYSCLLTSIGTFHFAIFGRSTPVEILHTLLLGPSLQVLSEKVNSSTLISSLKRDLCHLNYIQLFWHETET